MSWWLTAAAWIEAALQTSRRIYTQGRQQLLPFVQSGGRSMNLLRNGQWIDASVVVAVPDTIMASYSLETHRITDAGASRVPRWPWLAVTQTDASGAPVNEEESAELTEFFSTLRADPNVVNVAQSLMLFAFQKGWLPQGILSVDTRDGETLQITCADLYAPDR